jgi:hypothetical protein
MTCRKVAPLCTAREALCMAQIVPAQRLNFGALHCFLEYGTVGVGQLRGEVAAAFGARWFTNYHGAKSRK